MRIRSRRQKNKLRSYAYRYAWGRAKNEKLKRPTSSMYKEGWASAKDGFK